MAQIVIDSNSNLIQGDFDSATVNNRTKFQTSTPNANTGVYAVPNGSGTVAGFQASNNSNPTNASKIVMATNGSTDTQIISGVNGSGTYLPLSIYTNNALAGQFDTSGNLSVTGSVNMGSSFLRNRIINGDMRIDQRNAGASIASPADQYTLDRWSSRQDGGGVASIQQSSVVPNGFTKSLLLTVTTADSSVTGTDRYFISQAIEGFNIADFGYGTASASTVTLSFWVRSSVTGTYGGAFQNGDGDRSYAFTYTISAANTWEQKTVTIAGDTTGTWNTNNSAGLQVRFALGVGSTLTTASGSWTAGNFISANGVTNWISTNGATFYITGVQLEVGSTATPFERRLYGQELINCQRYYWRLKATDGVSLLAIGLNSGTTTARHLSSFPVPMRTSPSSLETSGTASDYRVWNGSTATNLSVVPTLDNSNQYNANILCTVASGLTANAASFLIANTGTAAYLGWSAEL